LIYLGVSLFCLHNLLYQIAAFVLYSFHVFELVKPFCLFGINGFYIHRSVHRESIFRHVECEL